MKKRPFDPTRIEISTHHAARPNSVELEMSSSTDGREFGIDNLENEEDVAAVVLGLQQAGIVESRARGGPFRAKGKPR